MNGEVTASRRVIPVVAPTPYDVGDVNMFLVSDERTLTLIDAGDDSEACWDALHGALERAGFALRDLSQILITHSHPDHTGLVNRITALTDVPVYAHPEAVPRLTREPDFLSMRASFYKRLYREMGCGEAGERHAARLQRAIRNNDPSKIKAPIRTLRESDRIGAYRVIEVPGHSPDHLAFWDEREKRLFAGDHLIRHISSNAFVEPDREGNRIPTLVAYARSLTKCLELKADIVYTGHGEPVDRPHELIGKRLARIEEKAEKLKAYIRSGSTTAFQLAQILYPQKYDSEFSAVMSEIIGLLDYAESKAAIGKAMRSGVWHYEA
ncbi:MULTISPECIES: MBL fold metallo-hydrolase [Paenibacillus]|uniref:MBL fold metallo-hydrolase n=1 Tax=Paenibacillus validus TaxID=44253 RepID=A0A7X2Z7V9_9BACL|nr:MBL fold metallo-hydrolase [Paenibacillus validus]MUG69365.1 MBL fold metallo-hydrolase [Paenibacillus validus]